MHEQLVADLFLYCVAMQERHLISQKSVSHGDFNYHYVSLDCTGIFAIVFLDLTSPLEKGPVNF